MDRFICGIDEVGRGPLAGPVLSAAVIIPAENRDLPFWAQITDSKKLSAKKREMLYPLIIQHTFWGLGKASPQEIDNLNIHHATLLAMKRAFVHISRPSPNPLPQGEGLLALIDGKFCPDLPCPAQAVIKGDSKHLEIAAASIIAKVTRDRMMADLHETYPMYGWAKNAGYGTAEHLAAISQHGVTDHHRKSFAPCQLAPLLRA